MTQWSQQGAPQLFAFGAVQLNLEIQPLGQYWSKTRCLGRYRHVEYPVLPILHYIVVHVNVHVNGQVAHVPRLIKYKEACG